jgi:hypothetical protein
MRIKRFYEKVDYKSDIENYFSDILDHLDHTELEITKLNSNLYEVEIYPDEIKRNSMKNTRDNSVISEINYIINKNKWQINCLEYILNAINALNNDNNIERVLFKQDGVGFNIRINTTISEEVKTNDWISIIDDQYVSFDDIKLKIIIKEKFNVELSHVSIDFDDESGNYMIFTFSNDISQHGYAIISFLKETKDESLPWERGLIFKKSHYIPSPRQITLFLNNGLQFY